MASFFFLKKPAAAAFLGHLFFLPTAAAFIGLFWLENRFDDIVHIFFTFMDIDQLEACSWGQGERRQAAGHWP